MDHAKVRARARNQPVGGTGNRGRNSKGARASSESDNGGSTIIRVDQSGAASAARFRNRCIGQGEYDADGTEPNENLVWPGSSASAAYIAED